VVWLLVHEDFRVIVDLQLQHSHRRLIDLDAQFVMIKLPRLVEAVDRESRERFGVMEHRVAPLGMGFGGIKNQTMREWLC
jgi:hypothetical protein